jgi:hypothetical protein
MGLIILFRSGVQPSLKPGSFSPGTSLSGVDAVVYAETGTLGASTSLSGHRQDTVVVVTHALLPTVTYQVAFNSPPLSLTPSWEDLSGRLREIGTRRGRSYEFDRMETGTMGARLGNRDAELTPDNSTSQYAPIKSTRPVRAILQWEIPFDLFRGITEGFPQTYQSKGADALVQLNSSDLFNALNNSRFVPGSTTLTVALAGGVAQNTELSMFVHFTSLPMPQAVPFEIRVAGLTDEWPVETMTVTQIVTSSEWRVIRSDAVTYAHPVGATIETDSVSFGPALSGERIRQVLERVGFSANWYDLDAGQSVMAESTDLAGVSPLEHINLVVEAEFGRFFASRSGEFTFRDRHSIILDHLEPVFTFRDNADTASGSSGTYGTGMYGEGTYSISSGGSGGEVPFVLEGELSHDESKLYNRVKITIAGGAYSEQVVDISNQDSIDEHFERVFERTFPYASLNDAESAAHYVLARHAEAQLRLPAIAVRGANDPVNLWPKLLTREIGERVRFLYQPQGGGDPIDKDLAIDGISHAIRPGDHVVRFQCTEVDSNQYWILGVAGYGELGQTTFAGF